MKLRFALCVAGALLAGSSCGDNTVQAAQGQDEGNTAVSNIIGGFDAKSPSLNAVGTIGLVDAQTGEYSFFCTGTLIGPKTVITAKTCAMVTDSQSPLYKMKLVNLEPIFFAVGPDALHPVKVVEAIAADLSPVEVGGWLDIGNDVAVYHLKDAVEGVAPMKVADAVFGEGDLNKAFVAIGFGTKDNFEEASGQISGTRTAGKSTLQALQGKSFELMLKTFDVLVAQMVAIYGQDVVDANMDVIQGWWDTYVVLPGYEAWAGFASGDVQTCHGDEGSPLVGREGNEKAVFGVASGSWNSSQKACDYGTFYGIVGTDTRKMLDDAKTYVDPCGNGVTVTGTCTGDVATRCTGKWEGDRRLSQIDCSLLDQACATVDGKVACVDPTDTDTEPTVIKGVAPSIKQIRAQTFGTNKPRSLKK